MGKHSHKKSKQQDPKLQALAKRKKEMKVFKLPTDMSTRINKKTKKVTTNLKKLTKVDNREKVDNQLKALHEKLVLKQVPKPSAKMQPTPIPKPPPGTKDVEMTMGKMHV